MPAFFFSLKRTGEYCLNSEEREQLKKMIKDIFSFLNETNQNHSNKRAEKYHLNFTIFKNS